MSGIAFEFRDGQRVEFGVSRLLPYHKRPVLYRMRGAKFEVLGSFNSDASAEVFDKILDFLAERLKRE